MLRLLPPAVAQSAPIASSAARGGEPRRPADLRRSRRCGGHGRRNGHDGNDSHGSRRQERFAHIRTSRFLRPDTEPTFPPMHPIARELAAIGDYTRGNTVRSEEPERKKRYWARTRGRIGWRPRWLAPSWSCSAVAIGGNARRRTAQTVTTNRDARQVDFGSPRATRSRRRCGPLRQLSSRPRRSGRRRSESSESGRSLTRIITTNFGEHCYEWKSGRLLYDLCFKKDVLDAQGPGVTAGFRRPRNVSGGTVRMASTAVAGTQDSTRRSRFNDTKGPVDPERGVRGDSGRRPRGLGTCPRELEHHRAWPARVHRRHDHRQVDHRAWQQPRRRVA